MPIKPDLPVTPGTTDYYVDSSANTIWVHVSGGWYEVKGAAEGVTFEEAFRIAWDLCWARRAG